MVDLAHTAGAKQQLVFQLHQPDGLPRQALEVLPMTGLEVLVVKATDDPSARGDGRRTEGAAGGRSIKAINRAALSKLHNSKATPSEPSHHGLLGEVDVISSDVELPEFIEISSASK